MMGNWDSYRDDLDTLKIELEKLFEVRNDVMRRVRIAEEEQQQMMKPTTDEVVQLWLSKVQAVETEVDDLIRQISQEIEELHPGGFCSRNLLNMPSSYEFEDIVADKLQAVMNLIIEGAFVVADDEARVVTIPKDEGVAGNLPEDVLYEEGTIVGLESIFTKVWTCLEEEGGEGGGYVGIIGLYGMGGVGKTTLLKQIYRNMLDNYGQNNFAVVIWVSVSKELRLEKIQEKIGMKIGLFDKVWKNKNFEEKASDILEILKDKKFVLLTDELWERVDLTKVGVPFPNPENSSKIVFTTRSLEICRLMEADRQFKINCLADGEAWELFKASVGDETLRSHPEQVVDIARDISKECSGLPLALASIGQELAGNKTPQEWRDVLGVLTRRSQSTSSISGSDDQLKKGIYNNLKSSYDHLQNDMFKSCLLYCCLFPRNDKISKGHLIDCWMGEGFLDDRLGAQSQGYHIIDVLLSACLLEEEEEDDNYVKMHNWIHDMSLWIATEIDEERINFVVCTDAGLTEPPDIEKLVNMTRKNGFTNLETAPMCSHLQTLFLNKNKIETIGGDFFQFMPCLKVLNLSDNPLQELPSEISNLVSLQHLDLSHTAIKSLPNQLGALKKLKCLNLESTLELCAIPPRLISTLSVLHVLRLQGCGFLDQSGEDSVVCKDAQLLIEELFCLKNLSMLSIGLRNSHALQKLLSSYRLQSCIQSLLLHSLQHPKSIVISISYMNHLKTLQISECEYLEELEVDFVGEAQAQEAISNFYFLDEVIIESCPNLRDLTWLILAPNLKGLEISQCSELEEIIKVGKLSECPELMRNLSPFLKLQILKLSNLPNLRSIYWCDLPFPDLKEGTIAECPKLQISVPPHRFNKDHSKEKITANVPSGPSSFNRKQVDPTGSDDVCGSTISGFSTLKRKGCKWYDRNLGDEQRPLKRYAVPLPSNPLGSDKVCGSTISGFSTCSVPFLFSKETKDGEDDIKLQGRHRKTDEVHQRQKLEVYNEVLRRLKESVDNEDTIKPGFDDELWAHFNRLPVWYALDVNVERADDVLMHKRLLHLAHDPNNRPAIEVRLVQVHPTSEKNSADSIPLDSPRKEASQGLRQSIHPPPAFGSSPNLEALAIEANKSQDLDDGENSVHANAQFSRHEITFSTEDKPKLLSQLTSLLADTGLNIQKAHAFSTVDGYSLDVFVVDGWPYEETELLKAALEKELLKIEKQGWPSYRSSSPTSEPKETSIKGNHDHVELPNDGTDVWEIDPKHLKFGNKVASLSYIDLYKGKYCSKEVAIKVLKPECLGSDLQKEFAQEVYIMRKVRHKNVVQFIGACTKPPSLCIITEFMSGGSVYDYLHKQKGVFKLPSVIKVAIDVSKGMNYLHQNNIIHRDLKAANLLMDENEVVKVADFGVARVKSQSGEMTAETGTYRWMAPEVIEHKPYDHKVDIFSFGVVLWELLTGKRPYEGLTPVQAAFGVVKKGLRPTIPKNTIPKLAELLERSWQQDPALRPDFSEIIEILQQIAKEVGEEGEDHRCKEKSSGYSCLSSEEVTIEIKTEDHNTDEL